MALSENVAGCISLPASTNLSTKQYYLVKLDTNGKLAVCGAGGAAIGVLWDKPNADGVIGAVKPLDGRMSKAICGAAGITAGDLLASDASGLLKTAVLGTVDTSDTTGASADPVIGSHVIGVALQTAVSGDVVEFLAMPLGVVPTTAA